MGTVRTSTRSERMQKSQSEPEETTGENTHQKESSRSDDRGADRRPGRLRSRTGTAQAGREE